MGAANHNRGCHVPRPFQTFLGVLSGFACPMGEGHSPIFVGCVIHRCQPHRCQPRTQAVHIPRLFIKRTNVSPTNGLGTRLHRQEANWKCEGYTRCKNFRMILPLHVVWQRICSKVCTFRLQNKAFSMGVLYFSMGVLYSEFALSCPVIFNFHFKP